MSDKLTIGKITFRERVERPPINDDLRRLCLSMLALLKRQFPKDWQRMVAEVEAAKNP